MKSTITELLPLAVVIAISPVPILAVIMMLLTDRERANPLAFLAGWICILTVLVTGAILSGADSVSTTPSKTVAVVFLVVAVGLIALAIHEWRRRPRKGEPQRIEPCVRLPATAHASADWCGRGNWDSRFMSPAQHSWETPLYHDGRPHTCGPL